MNGVKSVKDKGSKKVGIIIATDDPETCWVAVRYANFHLMEQKNVKIFFADSGVRYKDMRGGKYDIVKLTEHFTQAGGQVYVCDDREKLKTCLMKYFVPPLTKKEIVNISDNDRLQSLMTKNIYIREFKRII